MVASFEQINVGSTYTRDELAQKWGYSHRSVIERGVVTPSGDNKVILFVTEQKRSHQPQYSDHLVDGILEWEGPKEHGSEERMVDAKANGDEIHLFHRQRHDDDFTYCGRMEMISHDRHTDRPSRFTFRLLDIQVGDLIALNANPGLPFAEPTTPKAPPELPIRDTPSLGSTVTVPVSIIMELIANFPPPTPAESEAIRARARQYTLVFLRRGPASRDDEARNARLQAEHLQHLYTLQKLGKLVLNGPILAEHDIAGVSVYACGLEEARALAEADPKVVAGYLSVEAIPWLAVPSADVALP